MNLAELIERLGDSMLDSTPTTAVEASNYGYVRDLAYRNGWNDAMSLALRRAHELEVGQLPAEAEPTVRGALKVGARVEGGARGTEDHDTGRVLELDDDVALVAWDGSATQGWIRADDLREIQTEDAEKRVAEDDELATGEKLCDRIEALANTLDDHDQAIAALLSVANARIDRAGFSHVGMMCAQIQALAEKMARDPWDVATEIMRTLVGGLLEQGHPLITSALNASKDGHVVLAMRFRRADRPTTSESESGPSDDNGSVH